MDKRLNRISLAYGVPGLLLQLAGEGLRTSAPAGQSIVGNLLLLVGGILLIGGLAYYARAKGYNAVWGLLGLLSIVGLIILGLVPDRLK